MAGVNRKISAASARSHTRKQRKSSSFRLSFGLITKISAVLFIGFLAWAYQAIQPPPPSICGSPNGPLVTSSRIKLRDGRHLAYKEHGVPRDKAKYKIIFVHGFDSCRHDVLPLSSELYDKLGIYLVSFDRPGYGESDADPNRSAKSTALDIQELADKLDLGSKFYVIGFSMGGQVVWSCLKYIPHRLAGATLIAPVVNYWWPSFPANYLKRLTASNLYKINGHFEWFTIALGLRTGGILRTGFPPVVSQIMTSGIYRPKIESSSASSKTERAIRHR
ncbi:hypothetical protein QJS10_CPA08g01519 [Acorus calamus]|uniref:AB hydrolase-1 domain-containing protein n=1 Tax=Acorus calamus TaxID=4465 RepID=A0AAV9EB55_ACOCL|nr:hypothetical protein QJS10_CPA08g01519 [Acorus calamus]